MCSWLEDEQAAGPPTTPSPKSPRRPLTSRHRLRKVWLVACLIVALADRSTPAGAQEGPSHATVIKLVAAIHASGFFKSDAALAREMENNSYGFFRAAEDPTAPPSARGSYEREGGRDLIKLERSFFDGAAAEAEGGANRPVLRTLVHEMCHDLWFNRLSAEDRRGFQAATRRLFSDFQSADSKAGRIRILKDFGYARPRRSDLRLFQALLDAQADYSEPTFYGPEAYAILASLAFIGQAIFPAPLRPYYAGIIAEPYLTRARPESAL